jgi:HlyD family secretion protein
VDGVPDADLLSRFALGGDSAALEPVLWRHGAMVLSTCRRILDDPADAEDAFQATFLTLVRKAGSIRDGRALAGWLPQVARRASLRARQATRRRARQEQQGLPHAVASSAPDEPAGREIGAAIEEEVARLPEPMRVAFVLCQFEGRSAAEAAALIGCPEGTILSRLARARERLRARLTRRGPRRRLPCRERALRRPSWRRRPGRRNASPQGRPRASCPPELFPWPRGPYETCS